MLITLKTVSETEINKFH